MKQITIISGKGGTGKTSFVAAFAGLAGGAVVADCDVDAADLHLVLKPLSQRRQPEVLKAGYEMVLLAERCSACGRCIEACRFGGIRLETADDRHQRELLKFDPFQCEGCGCCADVCPAEAISLREKTVGQVVVSNTRFGPMVHARLGIAQANSGKLVTLVRNRAREVADSDGRDLVLVDGSPGVGCPVIASLSGVNAAVIITEPTVSGLHDLQRVARLCEHFKIRAFVVVNKWDLNPEMTEWIEQACLAREIYPLGRVAFDPLFVRAIVDGQTVVEAQPMSATAREITGIWRRFLSELQ